MKNLRKYGNPPFNIAVLHGGPGARGEMAPVAKELSTLYGILEPLQTTTSLDGEIKELLLILKKDGDIPMTLIGHSWGALFSYIFAARYPLLIKKIILVGSGCFEEKYSKNIMKTRLDRLNKKEKADVFSLMNALGAPTIEDKNVILTRFGKLIFKADSYDPLQYNNEALDCNFQIYQGLWEDTEKIRHKEKLLNLGKLIQCPVVAIHGKYDPHPCEDIKESLSKILKDSRFIMMEKCGHYPWMEKNAKDDFYNILKKELE